VCGRRGDTVGVADVEIRWSSDGIYVECDIGIKGVITIRETQ
jgi:hypothetical protein